MIDIDEAIQVIKTVLADEDFQVREVLIPEIERKLYELYDRDK